MMPEITQNDARDNATRTMHETTKFDGSDRAMERAMRLPNVKHRQMNLLTTLAWTAWPVPKSRVTRTRSWRCSDLCEHH
eukprot:6194145-Pleurochrysis_carterae.AAC.2